MEAPAPTPAVLSTAPPDGAVGAPLNRGVSASFSVPMDPASLTSGSFLLASAAGPVPGAVVYAHPTAAFWPASRLAGGSTFTARITREARSAAGVPLPADLVWSLTTGTSLASASPVSLESAGSYAILAKSGISTVPSSAITGDIGVSPAAVTFLTGFSLTADPSNVFSTSAQVAGKAYGASHAAPTPANLTAAVSAMEAAFTDAAARTPDTVGLGDGSIGGLNLPPGVYRWSTSLQIPSNLTLTGGIGDVWIFQIAQDLTLGSGAKLRLLGGAIPSNVFWQVSGAVLLGAGAHGEGVILGQTSIVLQTGASHSGRLLAQAAVTLDQGIVSERIATPATAVSLTAAPALPVVTGTSVVFTALGSGSLDGLGNPSPAAAYDYQFWAWLNPVDGWVIVQDYGVGSTYTLPGSTAPGEYGLGVDVRTSPYVLWDTYNSIDFFTILPASGRPSPSMGSGAGPQGARPRFFGSGDQGPASTAVRLPVL